MTLPNRFFVRTGALAGCALAVLLGAAIETALAQVRPLQLEDWLSIRNVGGLAVSADGRTAAFTISEIDRAKDRRTTSLWRVPTAGGVPERLTHTGSASSPRFSPDGRFLAFISDRHIAGGPTPQKISERGQVWLLPLGGGEAFPVTALKEGVDTFRWAPDNLRLVVVSRDPRDEPEKIGTEEPPAPPIVLTRLQHKRDGSGWLDLRRRHLYLVTSRRCSREAGPRGRRVEGPDERTVRRWRSRVVARRAIDRVQLEPQQGSRRQQQRGHLDPRRAVGRDPPADDR